MGDNKEKDMNVDEKDIIKAESNAELSLDELENVAGGATRKRPPEPKKDRFKKV